MRTLAAIAVFLSVTLFAATSARAQSNVIDLGAASNLPASGDGWSYSLYKYTIDDGANVIITGSSKVKWISIAGNATITLRDVDLVSETQNDGVFSISSTANPTVRLILEGSNFVEGVLRAGICVKDGQTVIIDGPGSLNVKGY
ncbi:MAG: hypothetical protein LBU91_06580, partial [Bacteroidales bacterium]|nr:hypothetical protein [Bacteroidales bacterium]